MLTLVTMWVTLRMSDDVQRRIIVDGWAASFIAIVLGFSSWWFLQAGGVVSEPPARAVFGALAVVSGVVVLAACGWLQWRRS